MGIGGASGTGERDEVYQSAEQRIWEGIRDNPVSEFTRDFIYTGSRVLYGWAISPLRMPTLVRKMNNNQAMFNKSNEPLDEIPAGNFIGGILGFVGGLAGVVSGMAEAISYSISEAQNGNYIPAIVAGGVPLITNIASGFYELGRRNNNNDVSEPSKIEQTIQPEPI